MADCTKCASASSCERVWKGMSNPMCVGFEPIKTQEDVIRHMNVEELAHFLTSIQLDTANHCSLCTEPKYPFAGGWLDWLQQEVEE